MTLVIKQNDYSVTTVPAATFTNVSPAEASYASTAATELSFMPVTITTNDYTGQTSTSLTFSDQTSTTLSFTNQTSTTLTFDEFFKIDGTLYGSGYYDEEFYTGRPFVMGRSE